MDVIQVRPTIVYDVNVSQNPATGFDKLAKSNSQISIYPNPSNGIFQVTSSNLQLTEIKVYDVNGRIVLNQIIQPTPNLSKEGNSRIIDASNLPNGVYNISLTSSKGIENKRIVIVR
jgi:hypothetical protein